MTFSFIEIPPDVIWAVAQSYQNQNLNLKKIAGILGIRTIGRFDDKWNLVIDYLDFYYPNWKHGSTTTCNTDRQLDSEARNELYKTLEQRIRQFDSRMSSVNRQVS